MKILEVHHLDVYRSGKKVLEDISFYLNKGEVMGIIGPNGGGKSTLVKAIAGLLPITKGEIIIKPGQRLAYVPQFASFDPTFPITVREVVLSGSPHLSKRKRLASGAFDKADALMEDYDLSKLADQPIGALSGGQTQRVLICRALMGEPSILLLDEPTASIDFQTKDRIIQDLKKQQPDLTIVLVSHDLNVVNQNVDAILCVNVKGNFHPGNRLGADDLEKVYGCPIEVIIHGEIPHRILGKHDHGEEDESC
jgi:zinc transport system ATP-binding protein